MRRTKYYFTASGKVKLFTGLFLFALLLIIASLVMQLKTLLGSIAVTRASNTVNRLVTTSVRDSIECGEISYENLIAFEKDENGRITALRSNMAEFNRLQAAITSKILQKMNETSDTELSIPLGTLTGSALLAGRGPRFKVHMETLGSCSARFENTFTHAGINQTTHSILLHIDVSISILLPGFRTSTAVSNTIAVAETVIVGDVPESYTYFHSQDAIDDTAREYAINQG